MEHKIETDDVLIIAEDGCLPTKNNPSDAGYDLYAAQMTHIPSQEGRLVPLGIKTAFDPGYVALLWDRSGLSTKNNLHRFAGVIDSSYRGAWKVYLFNHGEDDLIIVKGSKVCQALFQRIEIMNFKQVDHLPVSDRNEKGFGSSDC